MSEEVTFDKHPALRNFNRTAFMFKHVAKGVLKWGAIGLAAGAAAAIGVGVAAMIGMGGIATGIGAVLGYFIPGVGEALSSFALTSIGYGALGGGVIGMLAGGLVNVSNASEAADAEEDRLVAKYEQKEARQERMAALERRRDEQRFAMEKQGYAMTTPGHHVPKGRHAQMGGNSQTV